jgi:hypothetical protein
MWRYGASMDSKRLGRIITFGIAALVIALVSFAWWISIEVKNAKSIALTAQHEPEVIEGIDGKSGLNGVDGINGQDGRNGQNATPTVIQETVTIQTNVPVPGVKGDPGEPGPQGLPGEPGREIEIGEDVSTGSMIWKYVDDEEWQITRKVLDGITLD